MGKCVRKVWRYLKFDVDEDTRGVIKSHKSKTDRQYNDEKKKDTQRYTKHFPENSRREPN